MRNNTNPTLGEFLEIISNDDHNYTTTDIINYLEILTDGFKLNKCKSALYDIKIYFRVNFNDYLIHVCEEIYHKKGWEIPMKTIPNIKDKRKEALLIPDTKAMLERNRTLVELLSGEIKFCLVYLENKINKQKDKPNFKDLFINPDHAQEVERLFESNSYTKNSKWLGLTNKKTELFAALYVLKEKGGIIIDGKNIPQARIFYDHFQVFNKPSDRAFNHYPPIDSIDEFKRLFTDLK